MLQHWNGRARGGGGGGGGGGGSRSSVNVAFSSALSVNPAIRVKPQRKSKHLHSLGGFEHVATVSLRTEVWGPEEHHHFHLPATAGILSRCPLLIKTRWVAGWAQTP